VILNNVKTNVDLVYGTVDVGTITPGDSFEWSLLGSR
jgi:hypothetical protein